MRFTLGTVQNTQEVTTMGGRFSILTATTLFCVFTLLASHAQTKSAVLSPDEVRKVVPATFFFRGQSSPVQLRNSSGFQQDGKFVLAGLVDTSGYSSDIQSKYQGFLITEVALNIDGKRLLPGEYGFGFSQSGKFLVMDVGANDLFTASTRRDAELKRPVPLKIVAEEGGYRLYAGRQWVSIKLR
jgi:hypothetical protein